MTDRELLEFAAISYGFELGEWDGKLGCWWDKDGMDTFNPLQDDGDALRLAVKLRLVVHVWDDGKAVSVAKTLPDGDEPTDTKAWIASSAKFSGGIEAATRRAITRAAAQIQLDKEKK